MAAEKEEQHRPGAFKQQNKTHKTGRHRSKGQLDKDTKGTQVLHLDVFVSRWYTFTTVMSKLCSDHVGHMTAIYGASYAG